MVRKAEIKDAGEIGRILYQVNDVHAKGRPDIFKPGGVKYDRKAVEGLIADPEMRVFVSEDEEGRLGGYLISWFEITKEDTSRRARKTLYIDDLCVDEKMRGKDIGTELYEEAADFAKENGCDSITLNVWECNPGARVFYEKKGLVPLKTTMEKML